VELTSASINVDAPLPSSCSGGGAEREADAGRSVRGVGVVCVTQGDSDGGQVRGIFRLHVISVSVASRKAAS